jgi:hypothetical protein
MTRLVLVLDLVLAVIRQPFASRRQPRRSL